MSSAATVPAQPENRWLRELATYFLLAYVVSFLLWLPALIGKKTTPFFLSLGTFGPTIAALAAHRIFERNWRFVRLWSTIPNLLIGIAAGTSALLVAALAAAFFMTKSGIDRWQWSSLLQILTLFLPNLPGGPLGEEAGWRGFALARLQRRTNPAISSLLLGFLWANWHLPLILAGVYNVSWWQFTMLTLSASVFLSLAFNLSGGSTLCAVIVHGVYNVGTGVILNEMIGKATLYGNEVQHRVLWMAYASVAAILCVATQGRLGYRGDQSNA